MLYTLIRYTIIPLTRALFRVKIIGRHNIPATGGILAANHSDDSDPVFLSMITRRKLYFMAKHNLKHDRISVVLSRVKKYILYIERRKGKSQPVIDQASELVKHGNLFCMFPEGTTEGGKAILKGHTGVARISLRSNAPVIPIAIINNHGCFPPGKLLPRKLPKVIINIGRPMSFPAYSNMQNNRRITRKVTDVIMKEIKRLYKEYEQ